MQNQLVCSGCRTVLLYPSGSPNVRCTICNVVTAVPPPGMEMDRMVCSGCRRQLMYEHGASRVRCSCCQTVSVMRVAAPPPPAAPNNFAHVNCGNCRTLLMYPAGATSVRCSLCQSITNVNRRETRDTRVNVPVNVPGSTSAPTPVKAHSQSQTIIVQNPMSVDESGKLVRNLVVGVTT